MRFSFAPLIFLFFLTVQAADVTSDVLPENSPVPEPLHLSEPDVRKAEAFREFVLCTLTIRKDREKAFEHLLKAIERDPDSRQLLLTAAGICRAEKGKKLTEALVSFSRKHLNCPLPVFLSASLLVEKKEPEKARLLLSEYAEKGLLPACCPAGNPYPAQNVALSAGLLLTAGRDTEALELLDKARKIPSIAGEPVFLQSEMIVCRQLLKKGSLPPRRFPLNLFRPSPEAELQTRYEQAEKAFLESMTSASGKPFSGNFRPAVLLFSENGKPDKAMLTAGHLLLRNPEDPGGFLALAELYQFRKEFRNEARTRLAAMLLSRKASLFQLYAYAHALFQAGDFAGAARELDRCIRLGLRTPEVLTEAVHAHLKRHHPDSALRVVRLMPPSLQRIPLECQILMEKKAYEAALQCALKFPALLRTEKRETASLLRFAAFLIADAAEKSGHPEVMIRQFEAVLPLFPQDHALKNALGYTLADQNLQLDRAEKLIREALAAEPDNMAYLDSLAWVLYRKKRYKEALLWIRKALAASPALADPEIMEHAGDIFQANQLPEEALKFRKRALELTKDDHKAQIRIKKKAGITP